MSGPASLCLSLYDNETGVYIVMSREEEALFGLIFPILSLNSGVRMSHLDVFSRSAVRYCGKLNIITSHSRVRFLVSLFFPSHKLRFAWALCLPHQGRQAIASTLKGQKGTP